MLQPQMVLSALRLADENSSQKIFNVNEARGIGQMSPDSLSSLLGSGNETRNVLTWIMLKFFT